MKSGSFSCAKVRLAHAKPVICYGAVDPSLNPEQTLQTTLSWTTIQRDLSADKGCTESDRLRKKKQMKLFSNLVLQGIPGVQQVAPPAKPKKLSLHSNSCMTYAKPALWEATFSTIAEGKALPNISDSWKHKKTHNVANWGWKKKYHK